MQWVAKIGEMHISKKSEDIVRAFGLGSCMGVVMYDPEAKIGGILHCLLPDSKAFSSETLSAQANKPLTFVNEGIPLMLRQIQADGAEPNRLRVYLVGGASFTNDANDLFSIGIRNFVVACETLRQLKLPLTGKEAGGRIARTLGLHIGNGRVWIETGGKEHDL